MSASTRTSPKERKVDVLLDTLSAGDTLMVSELSRLGRSVGEIITTVDTLLKKRIRFLAVKEGICLERKQDLQTTVMVYHGNPNSETTRSGILSGKGLRNVGVLEFGLLR